MVLGVGGALVALAVVVPGIPMVVSLIGVVLILAVASIAALQEGGRALAGRVILVALVALAALVGLGIWKIRTNQDGVRDLLISWALRLFLVLVVLGVGWFLGRSGSKKKK